MEDERRAAGPSLGKTVFLRPIATPLSLGFLGVFFGTLMLASEELSWVPLSQSRTLDLGVLVVTVPTLAVACLWGFVGRDTVAATGFGLQAGVWGMLGLAHLLSPPGSRSAALAVVLAVGAAALMSPVVGAVSSKVLAAAAMFTTVSRWSVTAAYELTGGKAVEHLSGAIGVLLAVVCLYASVAFELEEQRRRTVLPTGRRGSGRTAIDGDAHDQVSAVANESGVRRSL